MNFKLSFLALAIVLFAAQSANFFAGAAPPPDYYAGAWSNAHGYNHGPGFVKGGTWNHAYADYDDAWAKSKQHLHVKGHHKAYGKIDHRTRANYDHPHAHKADAKASEGTWGTMYAEKGYGHLKSTGKSHVYDDKAYAHNDAVGAVYAKHHGSLHLKGDATAAVY